MSTNAPLTLALAVLATGVAAADTPLHEKLRCGGVEVSDLAGKRLDPLEPRNFRVSESGLCSEYSTYGWESTMHLHLGEGAETFLPQIEMAVDLWNTALEGFAQRPVINIIRDVRPKNYRLRSGFWQNRNSSDLVDDGQSVIYFKAAESSTSTAGFAHWRWDRSSRLREADIYINTDDIVKYGPHLAKYHEVFRYDDTRGVFARVNETYLFILHELGHALGLEHVSVAGNIMSYNYMPRMVDIWSAPFSMLNLSLKALEQAGGFNLGAGIEWFLKNRDTTSPRMYTTPEDMTARRRALEDLFTKSVELGEQDKMALMCIYDFEDWNH